MTCCEDGLLHLWSIKEQNPEIIHTLEFTRENEKYDNNNYAEQLIIVQFLHTYV